MAKIGLFMVFALLVLLGSAIYRDQGKPKVPKYDVAVEQSVIPTKCATNDIDQNVIVSISQRHMWACSGPKQAYDSAVITGMDFLPADLTPIGTYRVSSKQTDYYLRGSDTTGSWNDYVSYWMPFLSNQYGVYGFHDATWRKTTDFGNIAPSSKDASHGCVELPLAAAKWLYSWIKVGSTVTIEN